MSGFFFLLSLSDLTCALLYPVVQHCGKEKMPLVSMIRSLFESLVVTVSDSREKPLSKSNYQLCTKLLQKSSLLYVMRCNMSVWFYNKVILPLVGGDEGGQGAVSLSNVRGCVG